MRDSGTDYEQKKHQPFLDLLLNCTDEDGLSLTDSDIREEVDTFMFEVGVLAVRHFKLKSA